MLNYGIWETDCGAALQLSITLWPGAIYKVVVGCCCCEVCAAFLRNSKETLITKDWVTDQSLSPQCLEHNIWLLDTTFSLGKHHFPWCLQATHQCLAESWVHLIFDSTDYNYKVQKKASVHSLSRPLCSRQCCRSLLGRYLCCESRWHGLDR